MYKETRNIKDYLRKVSVKVYKATTSSVYYTVPCGNAMYKVRVADHFGFDTADIDVVFSNDMFIVRLFNAPILIEKHRIVEYVKAMLLLIPTIDKNTSAIIEVSKKRLSDLNTLKSEVSHLKQLQNIKEETVPIKEYEKLKKEYGVLRNTHNSMKGKLKKLKKRFNQIKSLVGNADLSSDEDEEPCKDEACD